MADSPEQRVAVGSLSSKVNLGKIFFCIFLVNCLTIGD